MESPVSSIICLKFPAFFNSLSKSLKLEMSPELALTILLTANCSSLSIAFTQESMAMAPASTVCRSVFLSALISSSCSCALRSL